MPPPDECLRADHRVAGQVDRRLVVQDQFVAVQRVVQLRLQRDPVDDRLAHARVIAVVSAQTRPLGPVHRQVGVAEQRVGGFVVGRDGDPHTGRDEQLPSLQLVALPDTVGDPVGEGVDVASARSGMITANSSPPSRATVSPGRRHSRSLSATATSRRSPVW